MPALWPKLFGYLACLSDLNLKGHNMLLLLSTLFDVTSDAYLHTNDTWIKLFSLSDLFGMHFVFVGI